MSRGEGNENAIAGNWRVEHAKPDETVQNIYIRCVERLNGRLANAEFTAILPGSKLPGALNPVITGESI